MICHADMSRLKTGVKAEGPDSSSHWCLLIEMQRERLEIQPVHANMQVCVSFCLFEVMLCSRGILMFIVIIPAVEKLWWDIDGWWNLRDNQSCTDRFDRMRAANANRKWKICIYFHFSFLFFPSCGHVRRDTSPKIMDLSYTKGWIE